MMILLSLLISLQAWSSFGPKGVIIPGSRILYGLIIIQVIFGTQVREKVDEFTKDDQGIARGEWLDHAGWLIILHRPLSLLVLGLSLFIFFRQKEKGVYQNARLDPCRCRWTDILGIILAYA